MFLCFLKLYPATDMQYSTNFFQIMFRSVSILFCCILFHSVMGRKRGRKNGKNGKKSPPKKKYRTTKKAYTRRYVPLKEDPQPDRSRGASHKEKDLNIWPEENMLPGHLFISHFPQIAPTVCVQGCFACFSGGPFM